MSKISINDAIELAEHILRDAVSGPKEPTPEQETERGVRRIQRQPYHLALASRRSYLHYRHLVCGAAYFMKMGWQLPAPIAMVAADYLNGEHTPPKKRPGRGRDQGLAWRDYHIFDAMEALLEAGMTVSRKDKVVVGSAADTIVILAEKVGLGTIQYANVKKVYYDQKRKTEKLARLSNSAKAYEQEVKVFEVMLATAHAHKASDTN